MRSFLQFEGEGDTANARARAIGGHPAVLLRGVCLRKVSDTYSQAEQLVWIRCKDPPASILTGLVVSNGIPRQSHFLSPILSQN